MNYEDAAVIRHMCEQIARTLGVTYKADIVDPEDSYTYVDSRLRIYDKQFYLDLSVKNGDGLFVLGMTIGGATVRAKDEELARSLSYIKALYKACHFIRTVKPYEVKKLCPN